MIELIKGFMSKNFKFNDWDMAYSIAASYTWAAAILVGMSMIQGQGLIPYLVWFLSNGLAILVFGWVTLKFPDLYKAVRMKLFRLIVILVTAGTIWFNMSGLLYISDSLGLVSKGWAIAIAVITTLFIWAYISFKGGLKISIITDKLQWYLVIGGVIVAVIITLFSGLHLVASSYKLFVNPLDSPMSFYNAFWACPLLLSALFLDGMFWQRAPYVKTMKPYKRGCLIFMAYLALAGILAIFELTPVAKIILFVCIFFASMSTIDSCMAAFWHQMNKKWGIIFGLLVTFLWLPFAAFPIFNLWQMLFSWFPFFFIALIIAYILMKKGYLKEPDKKTLEAADALPVLGKRKPF